MRKRFILLVMLLSGLILAENQEFNPKTQIITAEHIRKSGLVRLSDILLLANNWRLSTIDGFNYQASANGLSLYQNQRMLVMIDGHIIDFKIWDTQSLNNLPVSLDQVEFVEISDTPQIEQGFFAESLIHIHTKVADKDLSYEGSIIYGNETGDPGPYRYTKYWSPNVDRINADNTGMLFFSKDKLSVSTAFVDQVAYPTDQRILKRNRYIAGQYYPRINMRGYRAATNFTNGSMQLHGLFAYNYLEDFYYFRPYGREVPLKNENIFFGVHGRYRSESKFNLKYRLSYTDKQIFKRENRLDYDFDWRMQKYAFDINSAVMQTNGAFHLGVGFDLIEASTSKKLNNPHIFRQRMHFRYTNQLYHGMRQQAAININVTNAVVRFSGILNTEWIINEKNMLRSVLSYMQNPKADETDYWYWHGQGYDILSALGVEQIKNNMQKSGDRWTCDLIYDTQSLKPIKLNLTGFYRAFSNQRYYENTFKFRRYDESFSTDALTLIQHSGQVVGGSFSLGLNTTGNLQHNISYNYLMPVANEKAFTDHWKRLPRHKFGYMITFAPINGFSIWVGINYQSSAYWNDYKNIELEFNDIYQPATEDILIFSLSFTKTFWKNRINTQLTFRNLFNDKEIYHPIGAQHDLRFYIRAGLHLDR